jgi:hypothetical protein
VINANQIIYPSFSLRKTQMGRTDDTQRAINKEAKFWYVNPNVRPWEINIKIDLKQTEN